VPFAAEAIGGGYEVAWRIPGADQYSVWTTDADGNMLTNPTGVVSGSSYALQSLEPSFRQDLNGDGTLGVVTTLLESNGAVQLSQLANIYSLGGSSGPFIKLNGTPVTAGQFAIPSGTWVPFAAEPISGGYEVAWKVPGADQYSVWTIDAAGNMLTNPTGVVSGSSSALQSLEPGFHQDLNGDGTIGPAPAAPAGGSAVTSVLAGFIASTFVTSAGNAAGVIIANSGTEPDALAKPAA